MLKNTNINVHAEVVDLVFGRKWCGRKGTEGPKFSSKYKIRNYLGASMRESGLQNTVLTYQSPPSGSRH